MNIEGLLIAFTILSSSFLGSWHCAAMCGPIASTMRSTRKAVAYNLGRGFSYLAAGALGGALGSFFLDSDFLLIRKISGLMFALILLIMGANILFGGHILPSYRFPFFSRLVRADTPAFSIGILTVFLPCGWLYTYLAAAIATRSPQGGILVMILFWAGGLPALAAATSIMKKSIKVAPKSKQALAALILVGCGLYTLFSFYLLPVLFL